MKLPLQGTKCAAAIFCNVFVCHYKYKMFPLTRYSCCFALLVSTFFPLDVYGEGWSFDDARPEWGRFALGFVSGIAAHEAGHYVVATSKGYKVGHSGLSITYPDAVFKGSDQLKIASAGFQTQWLVTELFLRDHNGKEVKEPPGNFGAGIVCAHLGITLAYLTVLKNNRLGDIVGMAQSTSTESLSSYPKDAPPTVNSAVGGVR